MTVGQLDYIVKNKLACSEVLNIRSNLVNCPLGTVQYKSLKPH